MAYGRVNVSQYSEVKIEYDTSGASIPFIVDREYIIPISSDDNFKSIGYMGNITFEFDDISLFDLYINNTNLTRLMPDSSYAKKIIIDNITIRNVNDVIKAYISCHHIRNDGVTKFFSTTETLTAPIRLLVKMKKTYSNDLIIHNNYERVTVV